MIAIGLRSGVGILKKAETLLSGKEEARIYPLNYKEIKGDLKDPITDTITKTQLVCRFLSTKKEGCRHMDFPSGPPP